MSVNTLDTARLATALVAAFRSEAVKHWPWVHGDGWPAYSEHRAQGDITQTFLVNEIAEAIAREYEATPDAEELHPAAEWNIAGADR